MMENMEDFDALIIGSGEAGKSMAWHLGGLGERVAVVEAWLIGGSCPNIACLPSKNIIHQAAHAQLLRAAGVATSMKDVQARKRAMVADLQAIHVGKFKAAKCELVMGHARFSGERTVDVQLNDGGTRTIRGKRVFIDVGAFATLPPIDGLAGVQPMTHVELLELETLPEQLVILGAGPIGLELAQAMRRLGSHVTVIERSARLLPREDEDVSAAMRTLLEGEGIEFKFGANISKVEGRSGERVTVHFNDTSVTGTHLLVAMGKKPNTSDLDANKAGIELTKDGTVRVNERLETTAANVWAMGDCAGTPAFTHMAYEDFRLVRDNFNGEKRVTTTRQVPWCLYTEPELARVGLNELEAKARGLAYRLTTIPAKTILRGKTTGESFGLLKALVGADDRILGFTAFCAHAGELLPVIQLAMAHGLTWRDVQRLIISHPTWSEALVLLFNAMPK